MVQLNSENFFYVCHEFGSKDSHVIKMMYIKDYYNSKIDIRSTNIFVL
jgi:hypothetical protein